MPSKDTKDSKREKAREVVDILEEISILLVLAYCALKSVHTHSSKDTQLDRAQLSLCVSLIENGVNPEALAVGIFHGILMTAELTCDADSNQRATERNRRSVRDNHDKAYVDARHLEAPWQAEHH